MVPPHLVRARRRRRPCSARRAPATSSPPPRPRRVRAVLGDARIVVQLRDPVERAISNWKFSPRQRPRGAARSARRSSATSTGPPRTGTRGARSVSPYAYLERGRYAEQLVPWLETFPGLVRVQFLEDLVADPERDRRALRLARRGPDVPARRSWAQPVHVSDEPADELDDDLTLAAPRLVRRADRELADAARPRRCPGPHPPPPRRRAQPMSRRARHPVQRARPWRAAELDYMRESLEGGHTSSGGPFSARAGGAAPGRDRGRGGAAHDVLHDRPRAERDADGPRARRHGDRAVVHVQHQRAGVRPAGRADPVLRHRAETLGHRPRAPRRAARRLRAGRRGRPLRRHRVRRRRRTQGAGRPPRHRASSRTPRTRCSAAGPASRSAASAGWPA